MPSPLQIQATTPDQLRKFAAGGYLYAILDAYQAPTVPAKVQELGKERALCLFMGPAEEKYWQLAPYLIAVEETTLDWILRNLKDKPWGVFVLSKSGLETLRTHFRRFLIVQLPDGERWYFRYYDPRLLPIYLSNCLPQELELFYGPVRSFAISSTESGGISLFFVPEETQGQAAPPSVWRVRPEQFAALEQASHFDMEGNVVRQLRPLLPRQYQALTDEHMRKTVRYGIDRAASYGITSEKDLARYVGLMFAFGLDFDRDKRLPWAAAILKEPTLADGSVKMAHLWEAGERVVGASRATKAAGE